MGTRFSILKPIEIDSLALVCFALFCHLYLQRRCTLCFWAFGTRYLSYCLNLCVVEGLNAIVLATFLHGQPITFYSHKHNESADHIGEAQYDRCC